MSMLPNVQQQQYHQSHFTKQLFQQSPLHVNQQFRNLESPLCVQNQQRYSPTLQQQFGFSNSNNSNMVMSQQNQVWPNLQNRTNNTHYTKITPTNKTNPDSRNDFSLRQQVQDNYNGSKTLFDNATGYSVSKPRLFKLFNDPSQHQPGSLMQQQDPIKRSKIVRNDGISLPSSQFSATSALNARNIQTRNDQNRQMRLLQALGQDRKDYRCEENGNINKIKPKQIDKIQPVFDFKQKRRTMDSIFKTVSENDIIGLQNYGNQGNASMKGSFNDNQHSINQRAKHHQHQIDRKTSDDYIIRETNKINKIYGDEQQTKNNQRSPISQTSHKIQSILKQEINHKKLNTHQTLENHEELPLLSGFILKQSIVPQLMNSNEGHQNQSPQDQLQKLRNQRILKTSDPVQLLLLKDALYQNESQIKTNKIQKISSNAHKNELSAQKQFQTVDGVLMKEADLQFNGQNYSQYNVLIKHDPNLNQNRKIDYSRESSINRSPIIANKSNANKEEIKFNIGNNDIMQSRRSILKTHQTISSNQQDQAGYCFQNLGELDSSIKGKYFISELQVQKEALKKQELIQIIEELMQKRTDVPEQENNEIPRFQQKVPFHSEKQQTPKKVFSNKNINKFFRNDTLPSQYDFQAQDQQSILDQSFYDSNQNLYGVTQCNYQNYTEGDSLEENSQNQENYSNFMSRKQSQQLDNILQTINGSCEIYSNEIHPQTAQIRMNSQIFIDDGQFSNKFLISENREFYEPSFRNYYKNENMFLPQDQLQLYDARQDDQQALVQHQICESPIQYNRNMNLKYKEILQNEEKDSLHERKQQKQERNHTRNEEVRIDNHIIKEENIMPKELSQKSSLNNAQYDDLAQKSVFIKKITKKLTIQSETIVTQNKEEETNQISQNPKKKILNKVRILNNINKKQNNDEQEATAIKISNYDEEMMMLQKEIIEKIAQIQEQINLQQKQINFQKFDQIIAPQQNNRIQINTEQVQETQIRPESPKVHTQTIETQDQDAINKVVYSNQDSINERQSQSSKHQDQNDQEIIQKSPIKTKEDFQKPQKKALIVLKNNPDGQELSPNQDSSPQTKTQPITTITMLAPTMDALLNPIIQEIVNKDDSEIHLKEKIFKKGRKTTGKRIFAQNILLKLVKPRKELEEPDRSQEQKEKEDQEIEELKVQSQNTPKPPCGKKRYVDYLIEQNESPTIKNPESISTVQNNQKPPQQSFINSNIRRQNEMKRPQIESDFNNFIETTQENFEKSSYRRQNSVHQIQDKKMLDLNLQFLTQNQIEIPKESLLRKNKEKDKELSDNLSPKPLLKTQNSSNSNPTSQQASQNLSSSTQKGTLRKFKSILKKNSSTKLIATVQISNNQEILDNTPYLITNQQQCDKQLQDAQKRLPTIAIAKIPEARKTYGCRPRLSEVQIQIVPLIQHSQINQVKEQAQGNSLEVSQNRCETTTPNIGQFLKRYSNIERQYSSNIRETRTNSNIAQPQIKQLSSSIMAPPEFKHSNIDVEIIKRTLDSSVAIQQQKKLMKQSTKKPKTFSFNQLMIDTLDSSSQDAQKQINGLQKPKNNSPTSPIYNLSPTHNISFTVLSPSNLKSSTSSHQDQFLKPNKSSKKELIMPKSKSSNNFLEAQQQLQKQQHTKFHEEGTIQPKKSNKMLPKTSAKSISNIGKFMRAGPDRNIFHNRDFVVGQMHGKMF